jgi:ketosteroid isomerase-like protein
LRPSSFAAGQVEPADRLVLSGQFATIRRHALEAGRQPWDDLTANKKTVERYMEGFRRSDHAMVLSCLTADIEWLIPGVFHVRGKEAFDKEIENEAFVGSPVIVVTRLVEEADVVFAEGTVRARRRDGGTLNLMFCDAFEMQDGKICKLTSYLMEVTRPPDTAETVPTQP